MTTVAARLCWRLARRRAGAQRAATCCLAAGRLMLVLLRASKVDTKMLAAKEQAIAKGDGALGTADTS